MRIPEATADLRQTLALLPACVMGISTGDLNKVDSKLIEQRLQFGNALDLQTPTANPQAHGRKRCTLWFRWLRHDVRPSQAGEIGFRTLHGMSAGPMIASRRLQGDGLLIASSRTRHVAARATTAWHTSAESVRISPSLICSREATIRFRPVRLASYRAPSAAEIRLAIR